MVRGFAAVRRHAVGRDPASPPPSTGTRAPAPRKGGPALLATLLGLAAALRAYGLARYPFEQDELYTIIEAERLFASPLSPPIDARPLYYLLQHAASGLLPATPVGLRLLPFAFGLLGVWGTWLLARRLFGTTAAVVAAFLAAVSPWHLYVSGLARYWSMVYLLFFLFCFCALEAYRTGGRRWHFAALAGLIAGTFTHPTFLFAAAGVGLGLHLEFIGGAFRWRWPGRRASTLLWVPALVIIGVAWTAIGLLAAEPALRNFSGRGASATLRLLPGIIDWTSPTVFAAGGVGALLAIFAGTTAEQRRWGTVALLGTASSIGALLLASFWTNVYADYAMPALALALVSAGGLAQMVADRTRAHPAWVAAAAVALLGAGVLPSTVSHVLSGTRFEYREAFREIRSEAPELGVLVWPIAIQRHYAPELRGRELPRDAAALDAALAEEGELWAVVSVQRYGIVHDGGGDIARWLAASCHWVSSYERPRLDYRRYRVELFRCHADTARG